MTLTRKIVLRDAPPLAGTEIAVYIDGKATAETDGFSFMISRLALSNSSSHFTVEWGDGSAEVIEETATNLAHAYSRPGLYRIRISDDISSIRVSSSVDTICFTTFAPMVREFRSNAQAMTSIPRLGLRNATNLELVDLRGSAIRSLGNYAFQDCVSLRSLDGCSEISQLGSSAFAGCINLTGRVDFPRLEYITANNVESSPFLNTNIREFHFATKNEEAIRSLSLFYDTGGNFGIEGAVSYFDL